MSNVQFTGGVIGNRVKKLTTTGVTDIFPAQTNRCTVSSISCCEIAGGTSALTVEMYDPDTTTSYYLMCAKPMTARQTIVFDQGWVLEPGWKFRATASIANNIDIIVTIVEPGQG